MLLTLFSMAPGTHHVAKPYFARSSNALSLGRTRSEGKVGVRRRLKRRRQATVGLCRELSCLISSRSSSRRAIQHPAHSEHPPPPKHPAPTPTRMSAASTPVKAGAHEFAVRDVVLAKLKGYPQWPAMVVDPDNVPSGVQDERPSGKRHFCVRFFPAGDYAWLSPRDISPLSRSEIDKFLAVPKGAKRAGELLKGYKVAMDPTKWESEIEQEIAARAARGGADDDEDVEEEDEPMDGEKTKKRRRSSVGGSKKDEVAGKKKRRTSSGKKNGLSAETVESEEDEKPAVAAPAVERKKEREKEEDEKFAHLKNDIGASHIKTVRHQLQKTFLSKGTPTEKDLEASDALFKELETTDIPVDYLGYSKIGKVMRHIASLDDSAIPREAEYGFKRRAGDLVSKWHKVANSSSLPPAPTPVAPIGNGNGLQAMVQ
ncbi:Tudor/PWWP/MBT [Exidia glandulosa HHB12029]|uniref:Tudor/PWWP/MBT n=1 Tax=Exidia glandulosa HHB12029 TaxID=1314781 RepID=A0A165LBH2_EXIGL|nr:Tudor/PWWP/MBT [Exidia glandulosa HHB12029]